MKGSHGWEGGVSAIKSVKGWRRLGCWGRSGWGDGMVDKGGKGGGEVVRGDVGYGEVVRVVGWWDMSSV